MLCFEGKLFYAFLIWFRSRK